MHNPEPQTRFAVLIFTDIAGSDELTRRHGSPAFCDVLRVHIELFQHLAKECGLRVRETRGDGYLAEAGSVADAVRFALLFQAAMRAGRWGDIRLTSRVGINAGDVTDVENDTGCIMVGPAINLASRVMNLAAGGQILLTRFPFDEARHSVREHPVTSGQTAPPLRWEAHGPYLFKGNDEPVDIFEVGAEGFASLTPPPDGDKAKRAIRPGENGTLGLRLTGNSGARDFGEVRTCEHATFPFVRVRDLAGIYGTDDDPGAFSPSLREFEEELVHRPALAGQVQTALLERRFACLLGKGASGKTTLALVLAFSKSFGPEQFYYFDLAETDDSPDAAEPYRAAMQSIARHHGRDALVIVDNIHLAEPLAHKLHLAWREEGMPVRLLLQGRFTQQGADRRGRQSPLEELKRAALVLEVMPEDLAGVLLRLVRRANGNHSVSGISPAVLDQWLKVFGGELIAFSSAARRKLAQIVRGQYQLTEADSADYIREEYLENQDPKRRINSAERENLLAIAACADWELPVPAEGLPHPPGSALTISMRRGLVWQSTHGRYGQFARYRLCHPGMGKLLWSAAKMSEPNRLDQACALAQRNPFFGCLLANRVARVQGDEEAAKRVLAFVVSSTAAFERLVEHGMPRLRVQCRQLTDLGVLSEGELDQKLVGCKNLAAAAFATPLHFLANFLEYARTPMPKVWQVLADALADEKNQQTLVAAALATPLHFLANFLEYVRTPMPKVWQALADALADEKSRQTLVAAALASPLGELANFLEYARTPMPKVWQALADALVDEKSRQTLVVSAWATSLDCVGSFLDVAKQHGRDTALLWAAIESQPDKLAASAWATSLEKVGSFLGVAKQHGRDTAPLWAAIESEPNKLAASAWATSLEHVGSFLNVAKQHGRDTAPLWQILANAPDRLSQKGKTATLEALVGFGHYAPTSLLEIALR